MIEFVNLKAQYQSIKGEIDEAITNIIDNASFIGGKTVESFEDKFANFLGINHVIGCANGTDAIEILLQSMGVTEGDEVIVPAISWISTSEAVSNVGATPVFVDIEDRHYTIDTAKIEDGITENTKAIIAVHLYGSMCDMDVIMQIANKYNLYVLEDTAQAHNALYKGRLAGTIGDCASFSFYPGKNLGAYGDAGCMATNNADIAKKARLIANHGQAGKHNHLIEGRNSRLDALHASVLSVKLKYIEEWTEQRIVNANRYLNHLSNLDSIICPAIRNETRHVFHLYVIRCAKRDELKQFLKKNGVETAIHYPQALPFLSCYNYLNHSKDDFPVAADMQDAILSLPIYPELSEEDVQFTCDIIKKYFSN